MGLLDGLVVLGIFFAFGFMIYSKLKERNHPAIQKVGGMFQEGKKKILKKETIDTYQVHPEKRQIM